jgi:NSS family neurotransmitter:Na+ symporter
VSVPSVRETFTSSPGTILTMIGVAVGLGNVWRFPYLVGRYGGAAFVAVYLAAVILIGVPALMAEWAIGRQARRGTVGAFAANGVPGGRALGWLLFVVVVAATAYYTNVVGWVLYFALGEVAQALGIGWTSATVLPPDSGFVAGALWRQVACTGAVLVAAVAVLERGLRGGIERASRVIMPALLAILLLLIVRGLTLDGAGAGVRWYVGAAGAAALTPTVVMAALGHAIFSMSLGGTFMVTYGSYLDERAPLGRNAVMTATGDTMAGLLAGLAIFPAVFAFGLEPASGPGLLFDTLPRVFAQMPAGWLFGLLFFAGLCGAAFLSDVAALEVLVAGLVDNAAFDRRRAVRLMAAVVFVVSLVPMINLQVFVRWDLTFGSGMQTFGALCAALTAGWAMRRGTLLAQLGGSGRWPGLVSTWLRFVVPAAILGVGAWWVLTELLAIRQAA